MELQGVNEIKASHSSPSLKQHMITRLNTVRDAEAIFIILDKHAMNRVYNSRNGYKALFLALDTDIGNKHIQAVTIDRIVAKGVFDQTYKPLFRTRGYPSSRVEVNQGLSHEHAGLQFADLLAWVGFRKHEYSDNKLYDLLSIRKEEHVIKQ